MPGGFVDYNETVEEAAIREAREETNLDIKNLKQFHVYSDPKRDPRRHAISIVFTAAGSGELKARDDAREVKVFKHNEIPKKLASDHRQMLDDYLSKRY